MVSILPFKLQARETNFWCRLPANLATLPIDAWTNYSQPNGPCQIRVMPDGITVGSILDHTAPKPDQFEKCTAWDFDRTEVGDTIISEWNLVCDRAHLMNISEVLFLIGVALGGCVGGWISDR